jgi:hydrogenase maturation factor
VSNALDRIASIGVMDEISQDKPGEFVMFHAGVHAMRVMRWLEANTVPENQTVLLKEF